MTGRRSTLRWARGVVVGVSVSGLSSLGQVALRVGSGSSARVEWFAVSNSQSFHPLADLALTRTRRQGLVGACVAFVAGPWDILCMVPWRRFLADGGTRGNAARDTPAGLAANFGGDA